MGDGDVGLDDTVVGCLVGAPLGKIERYEVRFS